MHLLNLDEVLDVPTVEVAEPIAIVDTVQPVLSAAAPPAPAPITPAVPMNISASPLVFGAAPAPGRIVPPRRIQSSGSPMGTLLHAIPAALLAFCLLAVVTWDVIGNLSANSKPPEPRFVGDKDKGDGKHEGGIKDTDPLLAVTFSGNHRFGLVMLKEKDPRNPDQKKRLTYQENGSSNNTCINIDGYGNLFGLEPGKGPKKPVELKDRPGWETTWDFGGKGIRVTQHVEIVRGEQSQKLDTCLVWYKVENHGTIERKVGVRVLLDTYIGANDGVPFVIPGQKGLLTDLHDFGEKEIPDYIEALERPDPSDPGTVAHLGLKGIVLPKMELEPVVRMLICRWPGSEIRWELEKDRIRSIEGEKGEDGDSCVFLYWPYREMAPKEVRYMAFTYGLGKMSPSSGDSGSKTQLALTTGGSFQPGGVFTVTAYVKGAEEGQKIKLDLPSGLTLMSGEDAEKTVEPANKKAGYSQVSWRVKASDVGNYEVKAKSGGVTVSDKVRIKIGGVFSSD
jgi:hypothetical protein